MSLISIIVMLVVVGVILWAINKYIPMEGTIKGLVNLVVIVIVCLWLLSVFGLLPDINSIKIGR